jgi:hypothetical protein
MLSLVKGGRWPGAVGSTEACLQAAQYREALTIAIHNEAVS